MKKFIIQTILLLLVIGAGIFFFSTSEGGKIDLPFLPQQPEFSNLKINETTIKVEIADTASKRSRGLGDRISMPENEGMLFVFDREGKYPFWMKGLNFPLDFVFIAGDKVVDILENAPAPSGGQQDSSLPIYASKEDADQVLEVNAGVVQKLNIKIGDTVSLVQ